MNDTRQVRSPKAGGPRRSLRVLLVEDYQPDAILLARALERGGFAVTSERVDTAEAVERALAGHEWDLILCDHAMPQFSASEALEVVARRGLDTPFIIVSGHIAEETAVAAMRLGAHDYIMKDRLARLVPAVERELREAEVRRARRDSEAALRRAHDELEVRVEQRTADLKAANVKLEKVLEERRRLENELLEIAENERRRIGFDLHDDLGQRLTGISLMLKGLERRLAIDAHPSVGEARTIQSLIGDVIQHTHDLAHQFSSLDAQGEDLSSVLKALAGNVRSMFRIKCSFSVTGAAWDLPRDVTVQLYKIAQEAISNAIKHGKATRVAVGLAHQPGVVSMTIRNDGLPFVQPEEARGRMGLRIMNYRASTIGAHLEIGPAGRTGTLVKCTCSFAGATPEVASVPRGSAQL